LLLEVLSAIRRTMNGIQWRRPTIMTPPALLAKQEVV
jgi:hypothetical protein